MRRAPTLDLDAVLADLLGPAGSPAPDDPALAPALDAASALLAERGTGGWTVEDVAARAGVGRATIYRRFAGRDELVAAAIARDARRFFAAIADSVADIEPIDEKVIRGFMNGLDLVGQLPLTNLLRADPVAAMNLLSSGSLLPAVIAALTERYEELLGRPLDGAGRAIAESVAEGLVRLGLSFVLIPGPTGHVESVIRPLLQGAPRRSPRR